MKRSAERSPVCHVAKRPRSSGPYNLAALAHVPPSPPRTSTKRAYNGQPVPAAPGPLAVRATGPKGPLELDYLPGMTADDFARFNLTRHAVALEAKTRFDKLYVVLKHYCVTTVVPAVLDREHSRNKNAPLAVQY
ncbi:hypothetical protein Rhopal_006241-T1 [Rhodotorula paludigena]|uniref:Uncharacterized protein n=1 Tax=Rhodotorula paludigena TaxID=86838 RepID=A0AAV5GTB6_9BASI|nr:hypothetical protein Rhopal_006241-T1 [Rhodotorula paludigena]